MIVLVIWILFGIGCAICASNKNRSAAGWFFLGMLLGPFGFLFILLLSPLPGSVQSGEQKSYPSARYATWVTIIIIGALFYFISQTLPPATDKVSLSPSVSQAPKARGGSPLGRAYGAAGITKTLRKMGYPTQWTILGDTYGGSPVLILECDRFSEKSIDGFIERGILSDLFTDCFDRVDFFDGRRTWSYELNKSHLRDRPKGKSYLFWSKLTDAEFEQVDKRFNKDHGL